MTTATLLRTLVKYNHPRKNFQLFPRAVLVAIGLITLASGSVNAQTINPTLLHPNDNAMVSDEILSRRWPNGVVPFELEADQNVSQRHLRFQILNRWEQLTSGAVRFVKSNTALPRIKINLTAIEDGANGTSGLRGVRESDGTLINGVRSISIRPDVSYSVHHELGHVLGRWHHQKHQDSGECLTLEKNAPSRLSREKIIGRYTSETIMQYRARPNQADYETWVNDPSLCPVMALTDQPSDFDIKYFQKMYGVNGDYFNHTSFCQGSGKAIYAGDFNGDGLDDLLCHTKDGGATPGSRSIDFAENQVNNVFNDGDWRTSNNPFCRISERDLHIGDFNDDGRDDLLCFDSRNGRRFLDFANVQGQLEGNSTELTSFCKLVIAGTTVVGRVHVGDFDGDRASDMLCHIHSLGYLEIDYGGNGYTGADWSANANWCEASGRKIVVGEFDGDGRSDLLCHDPSDGHRWIDYANDSGEFEGADWNSKSGFKLGDGTFCIGASSELYPADITGNSLDDLVCHDQRNGSVAIAFALLSTEARNFRDAPKPIRKRGSDLWGSNYFSELSFCNSLNAFLLVGSFPTKNGSNGKSLYCNNMATGHQVGRYTFRN